MTTELTVGPALDAEIARRVFGLEVLGLAWGHYCEYDYLEWSEAEPEDPSYGCDLRPVILQPRLGCVCHHPDIMELPHCLGHRQACLKAVPPYSTDRDAALSVVDAMHARGDCASLIYKAGCSEPFGALQWYVEFRLGKGWAASASLPEAICRAALKALDAREGASQ